MAVQQEAMVVGGAEIRVTGDGVCEKEAG